MTRTPIGALLALTALWLHSTRTRRAGVILGAAVAIVTAVSLCVSALTLTAGQQRARDLGSYQRASYLSMELGELAPGTTARVRSALTDAALRSAAWIGSTTLRPDSYTKFFFLAPTTSLQYLEDPGPRQAHPGRYLLTSGRWPASPREVVVSPHLLAVLPDARTFTVLSGHARLRIVGVVTDRYTTDGDLILAGPGTWESLAPLPASRQYQPVEGQLHLLWDPPATVRQVAGAVTAALPSTLRDRDPGEAITGDLTRRSDPPSADEASDRAGVSSVPLLLIVLLVAVLAVAAGRRENRAAGAVLTAIGIRQRTVTGTQALAAVVSATTASAIGLTLGWLVTSATRMLVLVRVATHPLAPTVPPGRDLLLIAAAGILVATVGALLPTSRTRMRRGRWTIIVRVAGWLLAGAAITAGVTETRPVAPYLLLSGVLLLGPDLLHLLRATLPRGRPRTLVTRGLMHAAAVRQAAAVIVIGACVAIPLLVAAQVASRQASDAAYAYSTVPAGQIWVERIGDTGDVRGVARALAAIPGFPRGLPLRALSAPPEPDGSAGEQARFTRAGTGGTTILVASSSDVLHRLLGNPLSSTAAATLDGGGVLDFLTTRGQQRIAVYANGGELKTTTDPLPTRHVTVGRAWRLRFSGAILARTARALDLPVSAPLQYVHPDATPARVRQAVDAAIRAGYDAEFVHYTVPPPPPVLPVATSVFFAGLALGGFAVLLLTTADQTRRLRRSSSRLIAIGLTPAWTRSLLGLQTTLVTAAGLTTGIAAGLAALPVATRGCAVVVVPLLPAVGTGAVVVLAALLVTRVAARTLTARGEGG